MEQIVKAKKKKKIEVGGYNPLFHSEEFTKRLEELYEIYQNYSAVARNLNKEFSCDISSTHVKNLYTKRLASVVTHNPEASEFFEGSFGKMKKRWEEAWEMVGDLINQYKKLKKKIEDQDDTEQALLVLKLAPTIIQIAQEIRKQLEFIQKQQDQIRINQTNLIYSPIQINQEIHKVFRSWVDEGYLKVLKKIPGMENKIKYEEEDNDREKDKIN